MSARCMRGAVESYKNDVIAGGYPNDEESYHLPKDTRDALETILERKQQHAVAEISQQI